jgi:sugar/nucleoside kinase (ribokinase family)
MKKSFDVYLYGLTLLSTIHRLKGPYPKADSYQEIGETYIVPGGETANAAILLARLGLQVRSEGTWMGFETKETILRFNRKWGVDSSGLKYDPKFEGWKDVVIVDGKHRNVFGWFGKRFSSKGGQKWSMPNATAIGRAKVVSIDPFLGQESEKAARLCHKAGKLFVTLDCAPESDCHRYSAVNVISREFVNRSFPRMSKKKLMSKYLSRSRGLTVFTFGSRPLLYARPGKKIRRFKPYSVKVSGTLGAGDSFRAGMLYGLWRGWNDEQCVRFSAGLAACVCRKFPVAQYPPTIQEVIRLTGRMQ